jgi:hypothetical protein
MTAGSSVSKALPMVSYCMNHVFIGDTVLACARLNVHQSHSIPPPADRQQMLTLGIRLADANSPQNTLSDQLRRCNKAGRRTFVLATQGGAFHTVWSRNRAVEPAPLFSCRRSDCNPKYTRPVGSVARTRCGLISILHSATIWLYF